MNGLAPVNGPGDSAVSAWPLLAVQWIAISLNWNVVDVERYFWSGDRRWIRRLQDCSRDCTLLCLLDIGGDRLQNWWQDTLHSHLWNDRAQITSIDCYHLCWHVCENWALTTSSHGVYTHRSCWMHSHQQHRCWMHRGRWTCHSSCADNTLHCRSLLCWNCGWWTSSAEWLCGDNCPLLTSTEHDTVLWHLRVHLTLGIILEQELWCVFFTQLWDSLRICFQIVSQTVLHIHCHHPDFLWVITDQISVLLGCQWHLHPQIPNKHGIKLWTFLHSGSKYCKHQKNMHTCIIWHNTILSDADSHIIWCHWLLLMQICI